MQICNCLHSIRCRWSVFQDLTHQLRTQVRDHRRIVRAVDRHRHRLYNSRSLVIRDRNLECLVVVLASCQVLYSSVCVVQRISPLSSRCIHRNRAIRARRVIHRPSLRRSVVHISCTQLARCNRLTRGIFFDRAHQLCAQVRDHRRVVRAVHSYYHCLHFCATKSIRHRDIECLSL